MRAPENSSILNVCIIPPEEISAMCVEASQSLNPNQTMLRLGEGKFPHMTVYMARFSNTEVANAVELLEAELAGTEPFLCEHSGYFLTQGRYLEASFAKTTEFLSFHQKIMQGLSNLRINPGNPFEEDYFAPYTKEQRRNAEATGYDLADELYRPHITLTRYKEDFAPDNIPDLPKMNLSFVLYKVGIYKADNNGAVYEELGSFRV